MNTPDADDKPAYAASDDARQALDRFKQRMDPVNEADQISGGNPWLLMGGAIVLGSLAMSNKKTVASFQPGVAHSANALGAAIRNRRKDRKLTQKQLAEKAEVGTRFISEIETGKDTAEFAKILLVLNVLDLEFKIAQR